MKGTSCVREMHESVAKDLGYSFKKDVHGIIVFGHGILPHRYGKGFLIVNARLVI